MLTDSMDQLTSQLEISQEKIKMIKEARGHEAREATKKMEESRTKQQTQLKRIAELEK